MVDHQIDYRTLTLALMTDFGATPDSSQNLQVISSVHELPADLKDDVYGVKV